MNVELRMWSYECGVTNVELQITNDKLSAFGRCGIIK